VKSDSKTLINMVHQDNMDDQIMKTYFVESKWLACQIQSYMAWKQLRCVDWLQQYKVINSSKCLIKWIEDSFSKWYYPSLIPHTC